MIDFIGFILFLLKEIYYPFKGLVYPM